MDGYEIATLVCIFMAFAGSIGSLVTILYQNRIIRNLRMRELDRQIQDEQKHKFTELEKGW